MLKYLTGLHLVGFGQAFPDSSNHFAHERIVFQAHSTRNGLFKREPDIVGTNASCDRHKGLKPRTLFVQSISGISTYESQSRRSRQRTRWPRAKAAIRRERVALLTSVMFDTCFHLIIFTLAGRGHNVADYYWHMRKRPSWSAAGVVDIGKHPYTEGALFCCPVRSGAPAVRA